MGDNRRRPLNLPIDHGAHDDTHAAFIDEFSVPIEKIGVIGGTTQSHSLVNVFHHIVQLLNVELLNSLINVGCRYCVDRKCRRLRCNFLRRLNFCVGWVVDGCLQRLQILRAGDGPDLCSRYQ